MSTIASNQIKNSWKTIKVESHPMHHLCSRICSFPPSIPDYFIKKYSKSNDVVFDPWSGKGTVPFEALRNNRIGIGSDKSPEAFILTHAKVRPISYNTLQNYIISLKRQMNKIKNISIDESDKNPSIFYSEKTFQQLLKLKKILENENSDRSIFTKAIMIGLLHGNSTNSFSLRCSHSYSMAPGYVKKYAKEHGLRRPYKDVLECILNRGEIMLSHTQFMNKGVALQNDSIKLKLKSESVDMILTSPPYFNIQTYAWANWLRLWFLGYDYKEIRKELAESGSEEKYKNFMQKSINELYRVLKPGGKCFVVVGDIILRKHGINKFINTSNFLMPLFDDAEFNLKQIIVDNIPQNKKVNTYLAKEHGIKKERIIYLTKSKK